MDSRLSFLVTGLLQHGIIIIMGDGPAVSCLPLPSNQPCLPRRLHQSNCAGASDGGVLNGLFQKYTSLDAAARKADDIWF